MNRKQKLVISITGITIVMLALLGLTYGYYLTRIQGNTNTNSISITTADLTLTYRDGTGELIANNIMPGDEITSKTFTVKNEGEQDVSVYTVALINIMNNFTFKDDLEVSVSCSSNINGGVCEGFAEDYENKVYKEKYPATNSELFSLGIKEGEIHTFTLKVNYLYQDFDQSDDMGKTLKGKVQIYDPKDTIEVSGEVTGASEGDYAEIHSDVQTSEIVDGKYKFIGIPADNHTVYIKNRKTNSSKSTTLEIKKGTTESTTNGVITFTDTSKIANVTIDTSNTNLNTTINKVSDGALTLREKIMNDSRVVKNTGIPNYNNLSDYKVTGDATSGEIGMYSAEDDYGTSWYFKGVQSYNYVKFAGFTWRIIRINGNNSIRMVLKNSLDQMIREGESSASGPQTNFNLDTVSDEGIDAAYLGYMRPSDDNLPSTSYENAIKNEVDSNIKRVVDKYYEDYIENNDKNYHYSVYLEDTLYCGDKSLSIKSQSYVFGYDPSYYSFCDRMSPNYTINKPELKCVVEDSETTTTTKNYNIYSRYSVKSHITDATLVKTNGNLNYPIGLITADEVLLSFYSVIDDDVSQSWTMTPWYKYSLGPAYIMTFPNRSPGVLNSTYGVRPVINLRADLLWESGDGTIKKPYTVKLPN